jgi:hypothetical protein
MSLAASGAGIRAAQARSARSGMDLVAVRESDGARRRGQGGSPRIDSTDRRRPE